MNFVRGNSVLAANEHPKSREPLLQRDRRILEDSLNFDGELATAVAAFPTLLSLQVVGVLCVLAKAIGAARAIRPTHGSHGINANLFVAKVLNRLL